MNLAKRWDAFWFAPERPLNLGVCRALFFALMFALYWSMPIAAMSEVTARSPFFEPVWLLSGLARVARVFHFSVVPPAALMGAIGILWKGALLLGCLGLFTRVSTIVAFLLGTYIIALANSYGKFESQVLPSIFIMGFLALSRCGDGFSLDAIIRRARQMADPLPSGEYRWPVRAVWVLMAVLFFNAGSAKLRHSGLGWAWGPGFPLLMLSRFYDPNPPTLKLGLFIASHIWVARAMGLGSLFVETLFPLALFTRRGRWFFPLAAFGMQMGIGILMNIWFVHFLGAYFFWVPWDRVLRKSAPTSSCGETPTPE